MNSHRDWLGELVREQAPYHRAPPALHARVQAMLAQEAAPRRNPFALRWPSFLAGAATAALVIAFAPWTLLPTHRTERIEDDVLASHGRAALAQRLVDVPSSEHHTLKPWLSARLDFSPPVDAPAGSQLLGARIDSVGGRPAAVVVMRHAGHVVESYTWPVAERQSGLESTEARGFHIARWTHQGLRRWLVSDLNAREFAELVRQVRAEEGS